MLSRSDLHAPVDTASLALFRIGFGLALVWHAYTYLAYDWIGISYVAPRFLVPFMGFGWVTPWGGNGMYLHFAAMGLVALAVAVGWRYRLAIVTYVILFGYVFLLDKTRYQNHYYLILLIGLILSVLPAGNRWSLDVRRRPDTLQLTMPAWGLWLLRFQIGIAYFYGGIAKIGPDWLAGEPMRLWLAPVHDTPVVGPWLASEAAPYFFSYGGMAFDLLVVPALLWPRTRVAATVVAASFHLTNAYLFDIGVFPWFMLMALLLYYPPSWPARLAARWSGKTSAAPAEAGPAPTKTTAVHVGLAVYVAIQLLVPLRHYFYPGPANWTEQGHLFAWRMKLTDKRTSGWLELHDKARDRRVLMTEKEWGVYISTWQRYRIEQDPDALLAFVHFVAEELRATGVEDPAIYAHVFVGVNGREPSRLVDPTVDLVTQPRSLAPKTWLLPAPTDPVGRHRPPSPGATQGQSPDQ